MNIDRERLDALMADKGLTGKLLAEKAGITPQLLSRIKARGSCTPRTAGRLASALGVYADALTAEHS